MSNARHSASSGQPWRPDRRLLLQFSTLGLGALAVPGAAQSLRQSRGFTHGVASGEPSATSVLLWTRYIGAGPESRLIAELSETIDFARPLAGGSVTASEARDHTAKLTVTGLTPGRWYYYRFVAPDGSTSATGRTRTLPQGDVAQFNLGVFSCSNLGFGFFNAYAHAAMAGDIDLAIHLGDYFYEYAMGTYPLRDRHVAGREFLPQTEIIQLADYRLRYASYRADPALQRIHQCLPMLAQPDDHEFANDAWSGGAENHSPDSEGDWHLRKAAALQAWHEWMPVSDAPFRSYEVGTLATIAMPETRVTGRMQQLELHPELLSEAERGAALTRFRDTVWNASDRTLLGMEQENLLGTTLATSARNGTRWQVLAQQVIMGSIFQPQDTASWFPANAPDYILRRVEAGAAAAAAGLPFNLDAWDGYPAARARLLSAAQSAGANLVTLSGDSHNGWAFDLAHDGRPAGVEFAGQSVTSGGFESYTPVAPDRVATALRQANPGLKWVDTSRRGYMKVSLTPERASSTFRLWDHVRTADAAMISEVTQSVDHGRNRLND